MTNTVTNLYNELEPRTRTFLANLQQYRGPPIYTLSPYEARSVLSSIHGGGWILNGFDTHERLVRELANKANAAIVFVNYTRSPEAKYPISVEQVYAASNWVVQNSQVLRVDPSRLAVVGDSAGGNMAAAFTLLAQERQGPSIKFQVLF